MLYEVITVKAQWVQQYEWWYACQFRVNESYDDQVVRIVFEGVDYACDVYLNGHYLGSHEGAFTEFSFTVNDYLRTDRWNLLKSTNMLLVRLAPPPRVNAFVAGKKTPWFGDYWRDLIPMGIYRPVRNNFV